MGVSAIGVHSGVLGSCDGLDVNLFAFLARRAPATRNASATPVCFHP